MENIDTKVKATHTPAKSMFEIFCLRYPDISGNIFKSIDDQSLVKCKGISKTIGNKNQIQKYLENPEEWTT